MSDLFWLSEVDGGGLIVFAPRFSNRVNCTRKYGIPKLNTTIYVHAHY